VPSRRVGFLSERGRNGVKEQVVAQCQSEEVIREGRKSKKNTIKMHHSGSQ
jgi:hypothetical protein